VDASRTLLAAAALLHAGAAAAQQVPPPRFVVVGVIEAATLDTGGQVCIPRDPLLAGGTLTVSGLALVVPCNTVVQLPATSMPWAQLFDPGAAAAVGGGGSAPAPGRTGLALADVPAPSPGFLAHATGNVVDGRYVVGLLEIATLDAGAGAVRCIDHATGFVYVGGAPPAPGAPGCSAANGARVRIDDPLGRYGLAHSPDPRFTADTSNPTVRTATGFPLCVPRVAPPAEDPLCPQGNRPLNGDPRFPRDPLLPDGAFLGRFDLPPPADGVLPDARRQLPLEPGDWVAYSGALRRDGEGTWISAHTLIANLGVFTAPGIPPAYLAVDEVAIGTRGTEDPAIPQEGTTEFAVLGVTTDPTRLVDVAALDVNPCTGEETLRVLANVDPGSQPIRGRFHFGVAGGAFMPPTRELVVVSRTGVAPGVANGLTAGQYRLPVVGFLFPGNRVLGQPPVAANFEDLPFLAQGSGPLGGAGPRLSQLDPWPGRVAPAAVSCSAGGGSPPAADAGPALEVTAGAPVTLAGSATADPEGGPVTVEWTQGEGPAVTLSSPASLEATFTAPPVPALGPPATLRFTLRVTNGFGTATAETTVTVRPPSDLVTVTAALFRSSDRTLVVTARSSAASPAVSLEVVGLGPMADLGGGSYRFAAVGVANPGTVTVRSSLGGAATRPVTVR
jgi:hypothetical protein